jgi:YD repeat-containing protein
VFLLLAAAAWQGCGEAPSAETPGAKVTPTAVTTTSRAEGAWALFDRSTLAGWQPVAARGESAELRLALGRDRTLSALKLFGPAPYRLELAAAAPGGPAVSFDLSQLGEGWNTLPLGSLAAASLSLRWTALDEPAPVAELELWASDGLDAAALSPRALADAIAAGGEASLPPRFRLASATPGEFTLSPGAAAARCTTFAVDAAAPPATLARAYLVYETEDVFRPFVLAQSLNGSQLLGGEWLASFAGYSLFVQPVDPERLQASGNELTFCLPELAPTAVAIRGLRLVGETDTGELAARATLATEGAPPRSAALLLDGDAQTRAPLAAGERLTIRFPRFASPDAVLVQSGALPPVRLECQSGEDWVPLAVARTAAAGAGGTALHLEPGAPECAALSLIPARPFTAAEVTVLGSGTRSRVDWPRLAISSPPEHFGASAWLSGWTNRPAQMHGAVRIAVDGRDLDTVSGLFGTKLVRSGDPASPWVVEVRATFPSGETVTEEVVLEGDARAELAAALAGAAGPRTSRADELAHGAPGQDISTRAEAQRETRLRLGTHVGVDIPAGAVDRPTTITVRHLLAEMLPRLDPGLVNVTAPRDHGYEFLPHGQRFRLPVEVMVPYDPALLPEGKSAADILTYFYDTVAERWVPLDRAAVDLAAHTVRSRTDHFTIMINAVLTVPDSPQPLAFDPTALSSLAAASPGANVDLIAPPAPSAQGDAKLSLPLRLPAGRGDFSPSLAIAYASSRDSGWLGLGWDLAGVSRIEIDTRFGVPTYGAGEEPRYLLDGQALVPTSETEGPKCTVGPAAGRRYRTRVEEAFQHILRCGHGPASYHWEVRDRRGALYLYGDHAAAGSGGQAAGANLASYDATGGIYAWHLREVKDRNGNVTRFTYQLDEQSGPGSEPFRQVYLSRIDYTAHPAAPTAPYRIELERDDGSRPDRLVTGRPGFKVVTRHLLRSVRVLFDGQLVRQYVLTYRHGQFKKSVLSAVTTYGVGGCAASGNAFAAPACAGGARFHEHAFTYHEEPEAFAPPVKWSLEGDPAPDRAALQRSESKTTSGGPSLKLDLKVVSLGGSVSKSGGHRSEQIGFYDVNGDGLPDQAFDLGGDAPRALLNQFAPGRTPTQGPLFLTGPSLLDGLGGLERDSLKGWSASASAGILSFRASRAWSRSEARAERLLTDLDGDGRIDVLERGTAHLGRPCAQGICFDATHFPATDVIDPKQDPALQEVASDLAQRMVPANPVAQWTAPYAGRIRLHALARKAVAGGDDGVVVSLYQGDTLVESHAIAASDTAPHALPQSATSFSVNRGDTFYLRVQTGLDDAVENDRLRDAVDVRLTALYEEACFAGVCQSIDDAYAARHPSGAPVFAFDSQSDFRLAGTPVPVALPARGTVVIRGRIVASRPAARVRACLQRFSPGTTAAGLHVGCLESRSGVQTLLGPVELDANTDTSHTVHLSVEAEPGELLLLRTESELSFDPASVSLQPLTDTPVFEYQRACFADEQGDETCTTSRTTLDDLPFARAHFGPFVPLIHGESQPEPLPVRALRTGQVHFELPPRPSGPYLLAIRSAAQGLVYEEDCLRTSCPHAAPPPLLVAEGESLTFELVTEHPLAPAATQLVLRYDDRSVPAWFAQRRPGFVPPSPSPFAGGYRGWRYILWSELAAFAPDALLAALAESDTLDREQAEQIGRTVAPLLPYFAGTEFTAGAPAWIGPFSAAFVSARSMHAARLGNAELAPDGTYRRVDDGIFATDYLRLSVTRNTSDSFSVGDILGFGFQAARTATRTTTDVQDMTGDGIADVLSPAGVSRGAFGDRAGPELLGFDLGEDFRQRNGWSYGVGGKVSIPITTSAGRILSIDGSADIAIGRNRTTRDLIDLNGDGLPDKVRRSGDTIRIQYNLGSRFGAEEIFGLSHLPRDIDAFVTKEADLGASSTSDMLSHETTLSKSASGGVSSPGVGGISASTSTTSSRTTVQIADLNGDGLPDLLFKKDGAPILVQLNLGHTFGPVQTWQTPPWTEGFEGGGIGGFIDRRFEELGVTGPDVLAGTGRGPGSSGKSVSGSLDVPLGGGLSLGFGGSVSWESDSYQLALVDIDGTGATDHVLRVRRDGESVVWVKHNQLTGKANLLRSVSRPLGGAIELDYERTAHSTDLPAARQVLTRVTVDDGVELGGPYTSPALISTFTYEGGYFDRAEKEFFGFARVVTTRADGATLEARHHNRSYALRGRLERESLRDGAGRLFQERRISWETREVLGDGATPVAADPACLAALHPLLTESACRPVFVVATREELRRAEGGSDAKLHVTRDTQHDRFGNVLVSVDEADDASAADDLHISATYKNDTSAWLLGLPETLTVRAGSAGGTLLRQRSGTYDKDGNLTEIAIETGAGPARTTLGYDSFGNLATLTTPPNHRGQTQTLTYRYDDVAHQYVTSVTDGFGLSSSATYDLRFGELTGSTDTSGQTITRAHDAHGRLLTVHGPHDRTAPGIAITYDLGASPPYATTVNRPAAPASFAGPIPAAITTTVVTDGLGRTLQESKTAAVGGTVGTTASGPHAFDPLGRMARQFQPFFTTGPASGLVTPQPTHATGFAYDLLDRVTKTTFPDGTARTQQFSIGRAPDGALRFVTTDTDENGHQRLSYTDILGRTLGFVEHPTPDAPATTRYAYAPTGELTQIVDAEGHTSSLAYDLRGLLTRLDNPDTGLIERRYDLMGNLVELIEPNHRAAGTAVRSVYERNRLVAIDYPSKPDVTFTYGTASDGFGRAGRVKLVEDETGSLETFYGALGETVRTLRTVRPRSGARDPVTFDTRMQLDSFGRLLELVYPDGEVLTHTYDAGGALAAVTGSGAGWSRTYASGIQYDVFGNQTRIAFGNGTVSTRSFDPLRVRLATAQTVLPSARAVQDLRYRYDGVGNPTAIESLLPVPGPGEELPGGGVWCSPS